MTDSPDALAVFVTEYVRHQDQPDAGVIALTRAGLRDPAWAPSTMAERYLAREDVQAAIAIARKFYKPVDTKEVTTQTLSDHLEHIIQQALQDRQYQPAINGRKLQAELHGLLKQQVEHTHKVTVKTLTDEQLEKIAAGGIIEGDFKDVTARDAAP